MHARAQRASGGVACYVKDAIASRFELWRVSAHGSILWLRSKERFAHSSGDYHLHIAIVYIPPKGSSQETLATAESPYELLQQDLADVLASNGLALLATSMPAQALPLAPAVMFWMCPFSLMCSHVTLYTLDHLPISTPVHLKGVCWIFVRPLISAS